MSAAAVDPVLAWQQEMEGDIDHHHYHFSLQHQSHKTAASSFPTKPAKATAIWKMATTPEGLNLITYKGRSAAKIQQKDFRKDLEDRALMALRGDHKILDCLISKPYAAPASPPQTPLQAADQLQEPDFLSLLISSSAPNNRDEILTGRTERSPEGAKPKAAVNEKERGISLKQQNRYSTPYTPALGRGQPDMLSTDDLTESHELIPRPLYPAVARPESPTHDDTIANSSRTAALARTPLQEAPQRRLDAHSRIIAELEALKKEGVVQADDVSTGLVGYMRRQPLELALDAMWELRFAHLDRVRNVSGYLKGITRRMAEERYYMMDSTGDSWLQTGGWWQCEAKP